MFLDGIDRQDFLFRPLGFGLLWGSLTRVFPLNQDYDYDYE
jgi:hypothetical protein